jgi:hypothetical protein
MIFRRLESLLHIYFYFIIIIGSVIVLKCPKDNKNSKNQVSLLLINLHASFFISWGFGILVVL